MGVTSFGPHIRPGCNQGHFRDVCLFCNKKDVDLYTVCVFLWTDGNARGLGLRFECPACHQALRGTVNKTMPRMWINLLCVRVLFPMGSRELDAQIWELVTSIWSHGLNA